MIVAVVEQFDDNEITQYFLNTDKLNPKNPVDSKILKAVKKKNLAWVLVEIPDSESYDNDIGVTKKAKLKKSSKIDACVHLQISFISFDF